MKPIKISLLRTLLSLKLYLKSVNIQDLRLWLSGLEGTGDLPDDDRSALIQRMEILLPQLHHRSQPQREMGEIVWDRGKDMGHLEVMVMFHS